MMKDWLIFTATAMMLDGGTLPQFYVVSSGSYQQTKLEIQFSLCCANIMQRKRKQALHLVSFTLMTVRDCLLNLSKCILRLPWFSMQWMSVILGLVIKSSRFLTDLSKYQQGHLRSSYRVDLTTTSRSDFILDRI